MSWLDYSSYNIVWSLVNDDATHTDVYQTLSYFCSCSIYVDVYFIGHGFEGTNGLYGFACYDSVDSNGSENFSKFFYAAELESGGIHDYDYSTLRLGVGSFCHSGAFKDYFLNEGDVWIGSAISSGGTPYTIYTIYASGFFSVWGDYWYQNENSYTAYYYADVEGLIYLINSIGQNLGRIGVFDYYSKSGISIYW